MKIASWNVSGFRKSKSLSQYDYEEKADLDYFVENINSIKPDILLLQESLVNNKHSYAKQIGLKTDLPYFHDVSGTKSYIDPDYFESTSVISNVEILRKAEVEHINPHWEIVMENGYLAKSYDRSYQIIETKYGRLVHVHFLPERFFKKNYIEGNGLDYITKNLEMISKLEPPFFFCGDLNTRSINQIFEPFFDRNNITNAFKDIPTRPISDSEALTSDVICYPNSIKLIDKGVIKTETDHYLIWAEFNT